MNIKILILLIVGFAFSLFSCHNESKEAPSIDIPIFVVGEYKVSVDKETLIVYNAFEIDSVAKDGAYFMDIWVRIDMRDGGFPEGFPEFHVIINNKRYESSFKTQKIGWQSVTLANANQVAATVQLREGRNSIFVIGKELAKVELIKFYQNPTNVGISDEELQIVFGYTGPT